MGYWDDARDNIRRWWRDQTSQEVVIDESGQKRKLIDETPQRKMDRLSEALPGMAAEERKDQLNHLKAYTEYYYKGHQREEQIPKEKLQNLETLQKEVARLDAVDKAREVLMKYGEPPTRETIEASLERSVAQRERQQTVQQTSVSYAEPLHPKVERAPAPAVPLEPEAPRVTARPVEPASRVEAASVVGPIKVQRAPEVIPQAEPEMGKPIEKMTKAELREEVTRLQQRYETVVAEQKTAPKEDLAGLRTELKSIQATQDKYDKALESRFLEERQHAKDGFLPKVVATPEEVRTMQRTTFSSADLSPASMKAGDQSATERSRPALSLESYAAYAESIRPDRTQSQKLSEAIDGLSKEQIEKRIQQLEPLQAKLEAQEKAAHRAAGDATAPRYDSLELRGITRELGYLDNALHFKQQEQLWQDLRVSAGSKSELTTPEASRSELRALPVSAWKVEDVVKEIDWARKSFSDLKEQTKTMDHVPEGTKRQMASLMDYDSRLTEAYSARKEIQQSVGDSRTVSMKL